MYREYDIDSIKKEIEILKKQCLYDKRIKQDECMKKDVWYINCLEALINYMQERGDNKIYFIIF